MPATLRLPASSLPRARKTPAEREAAKAQREAAQHAYRMQVDSMFAAHGLPKPLYEYSVSPSRGWRFDMAFVIWPGPFKLALEVDGGSFGRGKPCPVCHRRAPGAHSSIAGMARDRAKLNEASLAGWCVLRVTPQELESGAACALVRRALNGA